VIVFIYNCDESGMQLDSTNDRVLAPKGVKHVYSQSMGTREHITVHVCVCANGKVMPPMIIFAKGFPGGPYAREGPNGALYAKSESGYMDGELYLKWFQKIFLCHCSPVRPVLLVQDGHKSHVTTELIDVARQEGVILFNLPPHTTHVTQPLDKNIFKPLKATFSTALKSLTFAWQDFVVAKCDFPRLFRDPFDQVCSPFRVKQSFRNAGICPFDPFRIKPEILNPSEHFQTSASSDGNVGTSCTDTLSSSTSETSAPTSDDTLINASRSSSDGTSSTQTPSSVGKSPVTLMPNVSGTPVNPLVAAGLIPKSLEDLLQVPQRKQGGTRTRVVTKAQVITGEEYMEELQKKEREVKEKEEAKQKRKEEREQKRKEKEEEKERKQKIREEKTLEKAKKKYWKIKRQVWNYSHNTYN